jgi:hypothetical protein
MAQPRAMEGSGLESPGQAIELIRSKGMTMPQTAESLAYEFLKGYHKDDKGLVEGWRRNNDPRWIFTVMFFKQLLLERR